MVGLGGDALVIDEGIDDVRLIANKTENRADYHIVTTVLACAVPRLR